MASRADTSSGDEHLDALLHVLGALKEEAAPVGLQEYREQVAQLRPLVRTIGTKFLVRDGSRLAVEGLAPVTTALKLIEYAIVKRPGILVGVPDAGKEGMETTGESQRGTLGEEPSLAFCDWVVRTLASLLAEDLPAVVIEQAQAVLVKVFLVLRDNLRDFAYLRRTLSAMLEWCRGSQESLLRYRQKGTVLYAAALAPWGGLESVEAIAIRSSSAATAFCGSLMSLMAQVLPPLWRGVGAVDAVADALLAMVVPDTFPNQESETGTVGFLRLLSSLFRAMDRSEVPLFVVDELLLKLWELAYGLSVSETDVPKRVQLEAASTMDHALRFVGKPQLDVIGPTLEATVGAMRRSCLESALKNSIWAWCSDKVSAAATPSLGLPSVIAAEDPDESDSNKRKAAPDAKDARKRYRGAEGPVHVDTFKYTALEDTDWMSEAKRIQRSLWDLAHSSAEPSEFEEVCRSWCDFAAGLVGTAFADPVGAARNIPWGLVRDCVDLLIAIADKNEAPKDGAPAWHSSAVLLSLPFLKDVDCTFDVENEAPYMERSTSISMAICAMFADGDWRGNVPQLVHRVSEALSPLAAAHLEMLCRLPERSTPYLRSLLRDILSSATTSGAPGLVASSWRGLEALLAKGTGIDSNLLAFYKLPEEPSASNLTTIASVVGCIICASVQDGVPFCRRCAPSTHSSRLHHQGINNLRPWLDAFVPQLASLLASSGEAGLAMDLLQRYAAHSGALPGNGSEALVSTLVPTFGNLQSTDRGYRLAAGAVLEPHARGASPDLLRNLADQLPQANATILQVYCLASEACRARAFKGDGLVLKLIDLLGTESFIVRQLVFEQMHRIARHHELQTKALLQPLLPDLSVQLIGIIGTQSQTVKDVSERLLNLSIKDFLERTLRYTLPHLVLQRNSDALAQLASVLKTDGAMLCVEHAHHILAKLFMEDEFEGSIAYLLSLVSPDGAISRFNLVKACALDLIAALTFELGSGSAARQSTVTRALETVQRELNADRSIGISATGPASLAKFLGHHFLGILAYANAQVRNETVSVSSRTAVLRSLAVVIKLLGPGVTIFTSQLLAAFQASLAIPELRSACLDGWDALLHTLDAATLGPNLGHVILALTSQGNLDDAHRKRIVAILRRTLEGSSVSLGRVLPDMVVQPTDRAFREALKPWTTDVGQLALPDALRKLLTACGKESPLVVENAVLQLRDLMRASEAWLASTVLSDSPDPVVSDLVPTLFETCHRFREESEPIVRLCGDCIGIVGAIDPARLSSGGKDDFELVVESFGAHRDAVAFVCRMLERQLVPAFKSSQDPVYQDPVAYAIQELLSFCGFTKDTPTLNPAVDSLAKMWHDFSPGVAQAIRPLLDSRYSVAPYPKRPVTYPIFRSRTTHRDWTRTLALDLIPRVVGSNAQKIFSVCESVVRNDVFGFSSFLLPHMVLNIVLCGTAADKDQLAIEILALVEEAATTSDPDDNLQRMCQTTFSLLDHLNAWMRSKYAARSRLRPSRAGGAADPVGDQQLADAHDFLGRVPHNVLAHASLNCKSYSRALKHVELHIREEERKKSGDDRVLPWLGLQLRLLANLDDADSMEGVSEKVTMPAMDQEVLQHEAAGRWTAAQSCYEMLLQSDAGVLDHHLGLMKCQRQLGHFESLLAHVNGTLAEHPEWSRTLNAHRIEASWRLGSWDSLDRFLESDFEPRFEASVGGLLSAITKDDKAAFERQISALRAQLSGAFSSSISGTYAQSYDIALKLHMLEDVQSFYEGFGAEGGPPDRLQNLVKLFESRVDITVPSHRVQEPLLDLRRALLGAISTRMHAVNSTQHMAGVHLETGRLWLKSAKIARKAGYFQAAYSDILHAAKVDAPFLQVEKAKWMWSQGDKYRALTDLNRFVQSRAAGSDAAQGQPGNSLATQPARFLDPTSDKFVRAKGHLLLARWMEETSGGQTSAVIAQYEKTTREHAWEKVYFYLGRYYIKLLENERAKEAAASKSNPGQRSSDSYAMTLQIVKMFSRALQHGTKYIYQTMPRMLTLYLDLGNIAGMTSYEANQPQQSKDQTFHAMNKHMRKVVGYLPAYQFLSAFPQILSQICHRNPLVFSVLETIMINVLTAYPQQGLWQLIPVSKSTFSARAKRGEQVLNKIKSDPVSRQYSLVTLEKQIEEFRRITDELLHLAQYKDVANPKATSFSISRDFKNLHKASHLSMIVPMQSLMSVNMPSDNQTVANHSPFGKDLVTIQRFMDEVEVMPSLVKPKKIAILGSDGKKYFFLCKPSDDLRKDARLMEFNTLVNRLLKKNPETRKRRLYIRTYFVTPLNEDSGMIEWVNNLVGFRNIIANHWSRRSLQVHAQEVKDAFERQVKAEKDNRPKDAVASFKALLLRYPPVFHEWFLETFPEPNAWLAARTAYTRTCAAISMVGYVVGLGDRHGENILFDSTNGDTVHVDLNCLFEKGLTFERPERVPFRLTQNMVDGFGTTGVEGMFRKSCEETMRVLRTNKDSLMSVLETFTHDPLLEWKKAKMVQERDSLEVRNESAIRSLAAIKTKLDGIISSKSSSSAAGSGLPLSVEGQVRELISSATDLFNLSMMYVGWASHL